MDRLRLSPMEEARERLRAFVADRGLEPGDRLPSERDLSEEWKLSRGTIRSAIQAEERDGRLLRKPGSGTYVARRLVERNLRDLRPFAEIAEAAGYRVSTELLSCEVVEAEMKHADQLDVDLGVGLYRLVRRRLFDGVPVSVELSLLPLALVPALDERVGSEIALYRMLEQQYGIQVTQGYESLSLGPCPAGMARLLDLDESDDVFILSGVASDPDDRPVEFFESYVRGDYVSFASQLEVR